MTSKRFICYLALATAGSYFAIEATAWAKQSVSPPDIYDYLVMNVCIDENGMTTAGNPLECSRQRNVRPGDKLSYVHADYPLDPGSTGCSSAGISRRYAFPLRNVGSDETGQAYPLIAAWTDYPPAREPCGFGRFDARDTATLLAVGPRSASLVGAHHHDGWFLTVGEGYRDRRRTGVGRFMDTWSFPKAVPQMGKVGWGVFKRRTQRFASADINPAAFPASNPDYKLTPTIQFWKRIKFTYGLRSKPSRPTDTLLHIPFTQLSSTGDAPGESRGSEHFYLTKELGYVTRWESWARDDAKKDVLALARKAYSRPACTKPATIAGQITPHLLMGTIEDDVDLPVYKQKIVTSDQVGVRTKHYWYLTGCHDFTNVSNVNSYDLISLVNENTFGLSFIKQFKSR